MTYSRFQLHLYWAEQYRKDHGLRDQGMTTAQHEAQDEYINRMDQFLSSHIAYMRERRDILRVGQDRQR